MPSFLGGLRKEWTRLCVLSFVLVDEAFWFIKIRMAKIDEKETSLGEEISCIDDRG